MFMLKFQDDYTTIIATFEDFILLVYTIIDDLYQQFVPSSVSQRRNLKCCDISFQCDQGMNLKSKVGFFFGGTFSIICPIFTERTAIACASKLTDRKRKTVNHKIAAVRNRKNKRYLLPEQFRDLQKIPSGSIKTSSAT